jgi:hypothetical protein
MTTAKFSVAIALAMLMSPLGAGEATESQQRGRQLLLAMAHHVAQLERFTVTVRGGYDVVQEDGRKIQFLETREIALARPDRLRAEVTHADGRNNLVLFDGKQMTVFDSDTSTYARAPQPGSIDDAVLYFVRELQMRLPLAPLFATRFPEELASRLTFADYVETTYVFEAPAHHVTGSTGVVDFQAWIADGDSPLLRRLVLTYKNDPGQPQFWAEFSNWNPRPRLAKDRFAFEPPANSKQIVFAVQLATLPPEPAGATPIEGRTP